MDSIIVEGGNPLNGVVNISGAKNAVLPLMAASILTSETVVLTNVPSRLSDITHMKQLMQHHGVEASVSADNVSSLILSSRDITNLEAPYDLVRKLRASIWVLAPLLARFGEAKVSLPGGCVIGVRQIDLHLDALKALGAEINLENGYIHAEAKKGLHGAHISFNKVSVGATITAIMATSIANGESVLSNCAREPEIINLCECLVSMGAKIDGIGTDTLIVEGVTSLGGTICNVIPDRIEAGTFMAAAAITHGILEIKNIIPLHLESFSNKLEQANIKLQYTNDSVIVDARNCEINACNIDTAPYPGIATDLQAQFMALMTMAKGTSIINETIFENRMMHVPELCRMGADIQVNHNVAVVKGVKSLAGAEVMASDLRASVSLIIAGLVAEGKTTVNRVYHLDRGYEAIEEKLGACGANIRRVTGK